MKRVLLTPAGLETTEGIARTNRAIAAQETAILNSANALRDLIDALRDERDRLSSSACAALDEAIDVQDARRSADEEFLRAISNHPPR
jgi:hypothetical protein